MFASLRGMLTYSSADGQVVLEVNGVGYKLSVPTSDIGELRGKVAGGQEILLSVHTHVREDAIVLYGFLSSLVRETFEQLIRIHGVGPSMALGLLSTFSTSELRRVVSEGDITALCKVPGVGKKTAERLVVDLRATLGGDSTPALQVTGAKAEAAEALAELGYSAGEIQRGLAGLGADLTIEEMLRLALRELATKK